MKTKILCLIAFSIFCLSLFSCNKTNNLTVSTDAETDTISDTEKETATEATSNTEETTKTDETSEIWYDLNAMGGSENPYRELYGTAVSGYMIVKGTFTSTDTYYNEADQEKYYEVLHAYEEGSKNLPLLAYLFRGMGITKQEYIDYLDALSPDGKHDASYDENIDILFSDDDDLINETFHSSLTLYHEGKIYTIYDLAEISNTKTLNSFPADKVAKLYKNVQAFNEKEHLLMPDEMDNMFNEMAAIASSVSVD